MLPRRFEAIQTAQSRLADAAVFDVDDFICGATNPWFSISGITIRTLYMSLVNIALVGVTVALLLKNVPLNRVVFFNWVVYMHIMATAPADAAHVGSNLATSARVAFTM